MALIIYRFFFDLKNLVLWTRSEIFGDAGKVTQKFEGRMFDCP